MVENQVILMNILTTTSTTTTTTTTIVINISYILIYSQFNPLKINLSNYQPIKPTNLPTYQINQHPTSNLPEQSSGTELALRINVSMIPITFLLLSILFVFLNPLTEERYEDIVSKLAEEGTIIDYSILD